MLSQRSIGLTLLAVLTIGTAVFTAFVLSTEGVGSSTALIGSITTVIYAGVLFAYWRGWEPARYAIVLAMTLGAAALPEPFVTRQFATSIFIAPVVALILASPAWVIGAAIGQVAILLLKAGFVGVYTNVPDLAIYGIVIAGVILGRLVADRALHLAEEHAQRAAAAQLQAERQAEELAMANEAANQQLHEQRRLLDLVATLETPAMQLAEGVLFAPLVGHLDSRRTQSFMARLLEAAHNQRAHHIIIDIAGVAMVDTAVARALISTAQSLRLLGCDVTITGISSNVALTLTQLGVELEGIATVRDPQEALARALTSSRRAPLHA